MSGVTAKRKWQSALRASAAVLLLSMLGACASAPPTQLAQADPRNGDGLGGTGVTREVRIAQAVNRRGDGIGGTGIVGTITGFGSIIVNGMELEFGTSTAVASDGRPTSLQDLRIGQVVEAVAHKRDGKLHLDALDIQHAVTGPIASIDYAGQTMTVLGQKVRLNLGGDRAALETFKTLQKGDLVSVSGLRLADGAVVATRVDQQQDDGRLIVRGEAADVTSAAVRIGGLDVPLASDATMSAPRAGGRVFVSGRMINGQFVPDVIRGGSAMPFTDAIENVSLEGYVPANAQNGLTVDGIVVDGSALPAGAQTNDHIVVTGRIDGEGKVTAAQIAKMRTVVTILQAHGSARPAALRPEIDRPDRVRPPERIDRPQIARPEITRPDFERPQS